MRNSPELLQFSIMQGILYKKMAQWKKWQIPCILQNTQLRAILYAKKRKMGFHMPIINLLHPSHKTINQCWAIIGSGLDRLGNLTNIANIFGIKNWIRKLQTIKLKKRFLRNAALSIYSLRWNMITQNLVEMLTIIFECIFPVGTKVYCFKSVLKSIHEMFKL